MPDATHERGTLKLSFVEDGREVPIVLVAAKLEALQKLLYHAAATVAGHDASRRGEWFNRYRPAVELTFASAHHSDLTIEARIPVQPLLLPEASQADLGRSAVDLAFKFVQQVAAGDPLHPLIPSKTDRRYLLKALEPLCPPPDADYALTLGNGLAHHPVVMLNKQTRVTLRHLLERELAEYQDLEEVTLTGILTKIHIETSPEMIAVRQGPGPDIVGYFDDTLRDQVANLIAGSLVEVTGWARLNDRGAVAQFDALVDIATVSQEPIRFSRFEWAGRVYPLRVPLLLNASYENGYWRYEAEGLPLWGTAPRREDALQALHEHFAYLWREFAEEADDRLDAMARELKIQLLQMSQGGLHAT